MEKLRNAKKSKVIIAIVASVLIIAGATMALLSQATQTANNNFVGAGVNVAVQEGDKVLENGNNANDYSAATLSTTGVAKSVKILNKTSDAYPTTDTYVRVRLVPIIRYDATNTDGYAGQVYPINVDLSQLSFTMGNDWAAYTTSGETYYYYTKALAPNELSTELMSSVKYTGTVPDGAHFELQVLTEGIAANQHSTVAGTPAYQTAWNDINTGLFSTLVASN